MSRPLSAAVVLFRRTQGLAMLGVASLLMGCTGLSGLIPGTGTSTSPTNSLVTFPTGALTPVPSATPTRAPTATPTSQPTATPTATPGSLPTVASYFFTSRSGNPGTNQQTVVGTNFAGLQSITLYWPATTLANNVVLTTAMGVTVNPAGTQINFTVPNLNFGGATTVTVQVTTSQGTSSPVGAATFNYTGP